MSAVMMECGHAANSEFQGKPACAICVLTDRRALLVQPTPPDLAGRTARCCKKSGLVPSSPELPFFEFLGAGSTKALESCKNCGYYKSAHEEGRVPECSGFEPHGPYEHDLYYCGHGGWD